MDTVILAKAMLKMMQEDDYGTVLESELASFVKSNTGVTPTPEEYAAAIAYLNALYPGRRPVVQTDIEEYPEAPKKASEMIFKSDYSSESLVMILDRID